MIALVVHDDYSLRKQTWESLRTDSNQAYDADCEVEDPKAVAE